MSDDFERRLQNAFHGGSLPPAPASLVDALQRVPDASIRSRRSGSGRSVIGLLVAAAVIATIGAFAVTGGSLPRIGPNQPAVLPSPTPADEPLLEYQLLQSDGFIPRSTDLTTTAAIMEARLAAAGVVGATVETDGVERITVTLPAVIDAAPIRKLIGNAGRTDFVPLGPNPVIEGQPIPPGFPPMFSTDQIASARVGTDQNGQPAIDFVLKPEGARLFGDYTSQNVGKFFAITVDDVVVSAAVIQNAIPGGEVQITGGGVNGFDATEAATSSRTSDSGAYPFPVYEVEATPAAASPS